MFYLQPDDAVLVLTLEDGSISEDTCKAEHGCFFPHESLSMPTACADPKLPGDASHLDFLADGL